MSFSRFRTSAAERGRLGAEKRWGPPRVLRLDDFDPDERVAILAAIDAKRAAKAAREKAAAEGQSPATAGMQEDHRHGRPAAA